MGLFNRAEELSSTCPCPCPRPCGSRSDSSLLTSHSLLRLSVRVAAPFFSRFPFWSLALLVSPLRAGVSLVRASFVSR